MSIALKLIISGITFALTVIFGLWLSSKGKPYNPALFNVHKLIALASVIFAILAVINILKTVNTEGIDTLLFIIAAAAVIVLFVSGALLSVGKSNYSITKSLHIISLVIAAADTAGLLFLFGRK